MTGFKPFFRVAVLGLLGTALAFSQGASKEYAELKKELADVSKSADKLDEQLGKTMASLKALSSGQAKDAAKQFNSFKKESEGLEKSLKEARDRFKDMRAKRDKYFAAWDKSGEAITNPDLKKASEERRKKVKEDHAAVSEKASETGGKIDAFMKQLSEVKNFLGADLNPSSITAAKPTIDSVLASGGELSGNVKDLSGKLKGYSSGLS